MTGKRIEFLVSGSKLHVISEVILKHSICLWGSFKCEKLEKMNLEEFCLPFLTATPQILIKFFEIIERRNTR